MVVLEQSGFRPNGVAEKVALTARLPRRGRGAGFGFAIDVLWPFVMLFTRSRWRGGEHIPRTGPVLLAANHVSFVDPVTVTAFVLANGRIPRYLAKASLWKLPVVRWVLTTGRHIPVHRGGPKAIAAYRESVDAAKQGDCVLFFPEGTFTADPDGWPSVQQCKSGLARLALSTGAPVIPIGHWGSQHLLPRRARFPKLLPRKVIGIQAGPPVDLSDLLDKPRSAAVVQEANERIVAAITAQLEQVRGISAP